MPETSANNAQPLPKPSLADYFELLRLPNGFTAMADSAMGYLFVQTLERGKLLLPPNMPLLGALLGASASIYLAGVALNDVFDLEVDRRERPERPLPSGRISLKAAQRLGWGLLGFGLLLGGLAAWLSATIWPLAVALLLSLTVIAYDTGLKNTWAGPIAMGVCRLLNVSLGMSVAKEAFSPANFLAAGSIGLYVAGLTWFSAGETDGRRRGRMIWGIMVMVLGVAGAALLPYYSHRALPLLRQEPWRWQMLMIILGLLILRRAIWATFDPKPRYVRAAVAQGVLAIVLLDAAICYTVQGFYWAAMILFFFPPAALLGRRMETA